MLADKLGYCIITDAAFPLQPDTRTVNRAPYRTSSRLRKQLDDQIHTLMKQGIIEERTRAWGSPVTTDNKEDESPRFSVDYHNTRNRHVVRETWPMPNTENQVHHSRRRPECFSSASRR